MRNKNELSYELGYICFWNNNNIRLIRYLTHWKSHTFTIKAVNAINTINTVNAINTFNTHTPKDTRFPEMDFAWALCHSLSYNSAIDSWSSRTMPQCSLSSRVHILLVDIRQWSSKYLRSKFYYRYVICNLIIWGEYIFEEECLKRSFSAVWIWTGMLGPQVVNSTTAPLPLGKTWSVKVKDAKLSGLNEDSDCELDKGCYSKREKKV